jgi:hypothetical protein
MSDVVAGDLAKVGADFAKVFLEVASKKFE